MLCVVFTGGSFFIFLQGQMSIHIAERITKNSSGWSLSDVKLVNAQLEKIDNLSQFVSSRQSGKWGSIEVYSKLVWPSFRNVQEFQATQDGDKRIDEGARELFNVLRKNCGALNEKCEPMPTDFIIELLHILNLTEDERNLAIKSQFTVNAYLTVPHLLHSYCDHLVMKFHSKRHLVLILHNVNQNTAMGSLFCSIVHNQSSSVSDFEPLRYPYYLYAINVIDGYKFIVYKAEVFKEYLGNVVNGNSSSCFVSDNNNKTNKLAISCYPKDSLDFTKLTDRVEILTILRHAFDIE